MDKIIPMGAAVVVIIVILGVVFFGHGPTPVNSTASTSIQRATTSIIPRSTVSSVTTVPLTNVTNCVSPNNTVAIYNGNFSTSTYAGWNVSGVGFGNQPANITYEDQNNGYYGQPWSGYNGTYFATSYSGGLTVAQGNITSKPFLVTEPYLNFKVISPQDNGLYVQILKDGKPDVTVHYNTFAVPIVNVSNSTNLFDSPSHFFNASIILVPLLCSKVQIKVVAGLVGVQGNQFNYIAVTNFTLSKIPRSTSGILVNQSLNFT